MGLVMQSCQTSRKKVRARVMFTPRNPSIIPRGRPLHDLLALLSLSLSPQTSCLLNILLTAAALLTLPAYIQSQEHFAWLRYSPGTYCMEHIMKPDQACANWARDSAAKITSWYTQQVNYPYVIQCTNSCTSLRQPLLTD